MLDDLGLIPALHAFMQRFSSQTGIRTRLTAFAGLEPLTPIQRTVLFRVAQEALTNVSRHACAREVQVMIKKLNGVINMSIDDNGKGFHAKRVLHTPKNRRLGLLGMKERLEMIGGSFTVESILGKGTTIRVQIPLATIRVRGARKNSPRAFGNTKNQNNYENNYCPAG